MEHDGSRIVVAVRSLTFEMGNAHRVLGSVASTDELKAAASAVTPAFPPSSWKMKKQSRLRRSLTLPFTCSPTSSRAAFPCRRRRTPSARSQRQNKGQGHQRLPAECERGHREGAQPAAAAETRAKGAPLRSREPRARVGLAHAKSERPPPAVPYRRRVAHTRATAISFQLLRPRRRPYQDQCFATRSSTSNQPRVFNYVRKSRLAKHFAKRFVPGETLDEALEVVRVLNARHPPPRPPRRERDERARGSGGPRRVPQDPRSDSRDTPGRECLSQARGDETDIDHGSRRVMQDILAVPSSTARSCASTWKRADTPTSR